MKAIYITTTFFVLLNTSLWGGTQKVKTLTVSLPEEKVLSDIFKAIYKRIDVEIPELKFRYINYPFKRGIMEALKGDFDIEATRASEFKRVIEQKLGTFLTSHIEKIDESLIEIKVEIVSNRKYKKINLKAKDPFKDYLIAIPNGVQALEMLIPKKNLVPVKDLNASFEMLRRHRVDFTTAGSSAGVSIFEKLTDVKVAFRQHLITIQTHPHIHTKHKKYKKVLSKTIKRLREKGIFKKITQDIVNNIKKPVLKPAS